MDSISGGDLLGSFTAVANENAQYTGTIAWSPNHASFVSGTAYTATITLTPKPGYTLQGVPANFFTVVGATTVSNSANSGVITAEFPKLYALGDTGPGGGKIFYYSAAGFTMTDTGEVCHYLEAAPDDMPSTLAWAPQNTNVPGTANPIGTGRKNTALILATYADAPAAKACNEYRGPNNLTDWFLPSVVELNALYVYQDYVGNMNKTGGTNGGYWSSTLISQFGNYMAYIQRFDGNYQTPTSVNFSTYVRAIRAF